MSGFADPRKNFHWLLELDGVDAFLIQEFQAPKISLPQIKHGAPANAPDVKTPGKFTVGDAVLKKLMPALKTDTFSHNWMAQAMIGGSIQFQKVGILKHLGRDGVSVVQKYFLGDVWPTDIETGNLQSMAPGENLIETLTLSVRYYVAMDSPEFTALLVAGGAAGIAQTLGNL